MKIQMIQSMQRMKNWSTSFLMLATMKRNLGNGRNMYHHPHNIFAGADDDGFFAGVPRNAMYSLISDDCCYSVDNLFVDCDSCAGVICDFFLLLAWNDVFSSFVFDLNQAVQSFHSPPFSSNAYHLQHPVDYHYYSLVSTHPLALSYPPWLVCFAAVALAEVRQLQQNLRHPPF